MLHKSLILPDFHAPFHDQLAFELVKHVASKVHFHRLLTLGDWWDFYAVSFHEKSPMRAGQLGIEIDEGLDLRYELKAAGQFEEDIFVEGNHEYRLFRYVAQNASKLATMIPTIGDYCREMGARYVPYRESVVLDGVRYTHHLETMGKYVVSQALAQTNCSFVVGDSHRMQYLVEGTLDGGRHMGFCPGWLGSLDAAEYRNRAKAAKDWTLGFGIAYFDGTRTHVTPVSIQDDYSCVVEGKVYRIR